MPAPLNIVTEEIEAASDEPSLITGCRLPRLPTRRPHPLELLSPDYHLARAVEYFQMGEKLVDDIGKSPEWRSRPEYAQIVNDIGRVCETINKLLGQRDWPLSECIDAKHFSRSTCALATQTSNTVRQEARRKTVPLPQPKDIPQPSTPTNSTAPVTSIEPCVPAANASDPRLDISELLDASSLLSSETDMQSISTREDTEDDSSSTSPLLVYPGAPV